MRKIVLILLKAVPVIGAICCASNSLLSYFGYDLVWVGYVMQITFLIAWYAMAVYFKFCTFFRLLILYIISCEAIISKMVPAAPWTIEQWDRMIETNELNREEAPYYNPYALFVVMSTIYADHAQTLAKIMGQAVDNIPENEFFKAIYTLALDRLKKSDTDITVRNWYNL